MAIVLFNKLKEMNKAPHLQVDANDKAALTNSLINSLLEVLNDKAVELLSPPQKGVKEVEKDRE